MKKRKKVQRIGMLLGVFLVGIIINSLHSEAGLSSVVLDDKTFEKELDTSLWNNPDEDVLIQGGSLLFPKSSTESTRLITKTTAKQNKYCEKIADVKVDVELQQIPKDGRFILAFGLGSAEALPGEAGNIEIGFSKGNGLQVQVTAYDEDGKAVSVLKPKKCNTYGNLAKVNASLSQDNVLTLTVNGTQICRKKLPCNGKGKIGFLQTGGCKVKLSNVHIAIYQYDRPENCNVKEDFEKKTMNSAVLTSKMVYPSNQWAPSRTYIDTIDGNRVFRFENAMVSYIGSCYKYSNFDLTFDVIGLQREDILNEDGKVIVPRCMQFAVSYGDEAADYDDNGYVNSTDILVFGGSSVLSYFTNQSASASDKGYDFYSPKCDRDFSIRVSMKDSVVTVGVKWIEEKKFTDIMTYQVSERTPTGYVHIWTTSVVANLSIDNLKLINTDEEPNLIEVPFESSFIEVPEDYDYQPQEVTYMEQKKEKRFNPYLVIPVVGAVCIVVLLISCLIMRKKEKKEGGTEDEVK